MTVAQVTVLPNTCCAAAWAILISPSPVPDWGLFILSLTSFSNTLLCPHWPSPMSMKHLEHGFILEVSKRFQVQTQSVLIYGKSPAMVVSPSNTVLLSVSWKKGKRNFAHHENSLLTESGSKIIWLWQSTGWMTWNEAGFTHKFL